MKTEDEPLRFKAGQTVAAARVLLAACAGGPVSRMDAGPPGAHSSTPSPPAQARAGVECHIGPLDKLHIIVYNQPDLTVSAPMRADGRISLPPGRTSRCTQATS